MIIAAMMIPLNTNVAIIQYLDLVLILPPDSINESSNIGCLVKSYFSLDTTVLPFVPELIFSYDKASNPMPWPVFLPAARQPSPALPANPGTPQASAPQPQSTSTSQSEFQPQGQTKTH